MQIPVNVRRVPWRIAGLMCLFLSQLCAQATTQISLQKNGWVIDCNPENASLSISANKLGSIASDIQLNVETPSSVHALKHLSARISGDQQLIIETTEPKTAWVIDALPGKVTITTTDFHGLLTGWAASSTDRTISILLDPQGEPVKWEGTDEVVNGWGGL